MPVTSSEAHCVRHNSRRVLIEIRLSNYVLRSSSEVYYGILYFLLYMFVYGKLDPSLHRVYIHLEFLVFVLSKVIVVTTPLQESNPRHVARVEGSIPVRPPGSCFVCVCLCV